MINGIINIRKEAGFTSHDVVAKLRGILKQKKIGHTGTLDPDAVGVLPVCLGKATRLCSMIEDWNKTYETVLLLGCETDTEDTGGRILKESPVEVTETEIREIIASFQGDYMQVPPMYSAKKIGGRKLYELAREGIVVEREACAVHLFSIDILRVDLPRATFRVTCSKGTYIRSLCRDIGKKAGCGGCMESLVRTGVEDFLLEDALTLDQVESLRDQDQVSRAVLPIDRVFAGYDAMQVMEEGEKLLYNGNPVPEQYCRFLSAGRAEAADSAISVKEKGKVVRLYDRKDVFIGIYSLQEKKNRVYRPIRVFL